MSKTLVLLNARAGTLIDSGTDHVVSALKSALAGREPDIRLLKPRDMVSAIQGAARGSHDTIIVGGGDGSAAAPPGRWLAVKRF